MGSRGHYPRCDTCGVEHEQTPVCPNTDEYRDALGDRMMGSPARIHALEVALERVCESHECQYSCCRTWRSRGHHERGCPVLGARALLSPATDTDTDTEGDDG